MNKLVLIKNSPETVITFFMYNYIRNIPIGEGH